jgi:hypothetical protein
MSETIWEKRVRIWIVAIFLVLLGTLGLTYFRSELAKGISEALIVAGVIAGLVDPLLKQEFLREASRGIFIHLLGFEHTEEVKAKLQDLIFETKLIRKSLDLHCTVGQRDGYFEFTVELDSEFINPTHLPIEFTPSLEFDKSHNVEVLDMSFTSSDGKCHSHGKPKQSEIHIGVDRFAGKAVIIQPDSKNVTYRGHALYRIKLKHGYNQFRAGVPTLRTTIRVVVPEGYEAFAAGATSENKNYWQYNSIQMVGDHVTLRWRKQNGEWL